MCGESGSNKRPWHHLFLFAMLYYCQNDVSLSLVYIYKIYIYIYAVYKIYICGICPSVTDSILYRMYIVYTFRYFYIIIDEFNSRVFGCDAVSPVFSKCIFGFLIGFSI